MQKRVNQNSEATFITVDMACQQTNLGRNTVRKMARECKATRKIGKALRINRLVLLEYLDSFGE